MKKWVFWSAAGLEAARLQTSRPPPAATKFQNEKFYFSRRPSIGQPSEPMACLALPPRSMRCSSTSWQSAHEDAYLLASQNSSASPLCAMVWCTTVAARTTPRDRHLSHRGCLRSCAARAASHRAVLYHLRQGCSVRRLASCSRLRTLRSSGLGTVARCFRYISTQHHEAVGLRDRATLLC